MSEEQYLAIYEAMVSLNHYSRSRIISKKPYDILATGEMLAILRGCPSVEVDIGNFRENNFRMTLGESKLLIKVRFDMDIPGMQDLADMVETL
jgi:hypothetical protein